MELSWAAPDLTSGNPNSLNDAQITTRQYRQSPDGGTTWTPDWTDIPNSGLGQAHGTHYRVTGLTNDAPYTFELRAVNDYGGVGQGTGPASTVTSTPGARPLAPPTGLRATAGNGYVVLEWAHPQNPAISGYDWQVREAGEPFGAWVVLQSDPHTTRFSRPAENDVTYTYRLRVRDRDGRVSLPAAVTVTPRAAPPLPIALTASLASRSVRGTLRDVITLQWDRPDDIGSLTHYDYQYKTGTAAYGPWTQLRGHDSTHCTGSSGGVCATPPYVDVLSDPITHHLVRLPGTALESGVTYTFRLRAHNETGTTLSAPVTITFVPTDEIVGRTPPKLTITGVRYPNEGNAVVSEEDRRPDFAFARPATSEYGVLTYEYSIDGGRTWYADLADDSKYVEGTDYAHQVRAVSLRGPGPASDPVRARYFSEAEAPMPIDATRVAYDATTQRLTLHWPASTNPYVVERRYGSGAQRAVLAPDVTRYTLPQPVAVGERVDITLRECVGLPRGADGQSNCLQAYTRFGSTFSTAGLPHQPQGLRGAPGDGQARLTWLDPEDPGITGYEYQAQTSRSTPLSSAWNPIAGTEATTTDYVVRGLTNYQAYHLWLRAVNAQGPSASSLAVVVTPQPAGIPATPANLLSSAVNDGRVVVWADPGDRSLTHYEYRHRRSGTTCRIRDPWETTWQRLSIPPSRQGYHRVYLTPAGCGFQLRAVNAQGPSLPREAVSEFPRPATPTGFAVTPGPAQLTLTWDEPWRDVVTVYRYTLDGGTTWVDIPDSGPTATGTLSRYTLTGLTNGQAYAVSLQAANAREASAPTAAVTATPRAVVPRAPTGVRVTSAWTEDAAQLTWADPGDPSLTGYQVQQNGQWTAIPGSTPETVEHTVTGLTPGTPYRFAVRARNAQGASPASAPVTLVAGEAGETTGFTVTPGNGQVTLRWTDPSGRGVTGYAYQQDGGRWTAITGVPPYVLTGLTNNRAYTVALRSRTPYGPGPATAPVTVTPVHPDAPPRIRVISVEPTIGGGNPLPLGSLRLQWEAGDTIDQPIDFYQYRQSEDAGRTWGAWTRPQTPVSDRDSRTILNTISYVISGLRDHQAYTYQVRGVNDHDGDGQPDTVRPPWQSQAPPGSAQAPPAPRAQAPPPAARAGRATAPAAALAVTRRTPRTPLMPPRWSPSPSRPRPCPRAHQCPAGLGHLLPGPRRRPPDLYRRGPNSDRGHGHPHRGAAHPHRDHPRHRHRNRHRPGPRRGHRTASRHGDRHPGGHRTDSSPASTGDPGSALQTGLSPE